MSRREGCFIATSWLVSLVALTIGGCPLDAPPSDVALIGPLPGTYYVDQSAGKLFYFQLAEARGAENRWQELANDGAWFTGPGFYRLSEEYIWSRDEGAERLTLDEVIQLHDPAPATGAMP